MTLLLIALPLAAVLAQDDLGDGIPETRRYTVEMIIFRYAQDVSIGTEIFPGDKPATNDLLVTEEPDLIDDEPVEEIPRFYRDIDFVLLAEDDYSMGDILRRLERLDVYEPLMHFGWTQATWPDDDTRPIKLESMGRLPQGLDGTLRLYLGRYLHLVVDLELAGPDTPGDSSSPLVYGDYRSLNNLRDGGEPGPVRYRIEENRILRSGELRYFDHPKFGALARVTRVEETPEEADDEISDNADTELLGYPPE
jgi:hypothetical protein